MNSKNRDEILPEAFEDRVIERKFIKNLKLSLKILLAVFLGILFFLVIEIGIGEVLLRWYMSKYQIDQRAELSEDMGFGMLATGVLFLTMAVLFPVGVYLSWRWLGRIAWLN